MMTYVSRMMMLESDMCSGRLEFAVLYFVPLLSPRLQCMIAQSLVRTRLRAPGAVAVFNIVIAVCVGVTSKPAAAARSSRA